MRPKDIVAEGTLWSLYIDQCNGERGDDERICKWVTAGIVNRITRDKHDSSQAS